MTQMPLTRRKTDPEKAAAIRAAVRAVAYPPDGARRIPSAADARAFYALIADPRVSSPIYTLPKPPTLEAAREFIERHIAEQARGEGLLIFETDAAGGAGAAAAFDWLFNFIGVDLICETAALDNIRTKKLLERIGFRFVSEIESDLPGGGVRPSLYFEMTRQEWRAYKT